LYLIGRTGFDHPWGKKVLYKSAENKTKGERRILLEVRSWQPGGQLEQSYKAPLLDTE